MKTYACRAIVSFFVILLLSLANGAAAALAAALPAAKPSAPDAAFSATPTTVAAPGTVSFTDRSTGSIKSWLWDFGDGKSSTQKNPSHVYQNAGKYSVALTVTGPGGSDTAVKGSYITVKAAVQPPPVEPPPVQPPVDPPPVQPPVQTGSDEYQIHVDSSAHLKFGLYYPATYKFRLPAGATNLSAEYRTGDGAWKALPEKTSTDFFNGIDAARFDYANGFAYLSARFAPNSDDLFLRVLDSSGHPVPLSFDLIPPYYDNRKAAVSLILDDWNTNFDTEFSTAIGYLIPRNLYFTVAIIAGDVSFSSVQQKLDQYNDFFELASHSLHHACSAVDYAANGYQAETTGSRDAINGNLTYPTKPYVPVFVEPCGYSDTSLEAGITAANYLVTRSSNDSFNTGSQFIPWDNLQQRYGRAGVVYNDDRPGDTATLLTEANALFDRAIAAGGIYALMDHPEKGYWHDNSYLLQHLDRIKGRTDLWYVPFGQLYQYHFLQENRGNLTIQHVTSPALAANFSAAPLSGRSPLAVSFTDASTGSVTGWSWAFGDGGTSSQQNPLHTYIIGGTYSVKLTVTGPLGTDTSTKADYIKIDVPGSALISITAPASGATYSAPATIPISASATAATGTSIARVDFYAGSQLIASVSAPPYLFNWSNVPAGSYSLAAEQRDPAGNVTRSAPVSVTVTGALPAAPVITGVTAASGHADVAFTAAADGGSPITGYVVNASPGNLVGTGTASPIRVSGLSNGTAYTFRIAAKSAMGTGLFSAVSPPATPLPDGDLNGDGAVDMSDGILGLRMVLGLQNATPDHLKAGDVAPLADGKPDSDGKIELSDVIVILRRALGLVTW
jgi:PKD repeat protein